MTILEGKAEALRKVNPSLTREQAFARAYTDRANADIAKIERAANEARFAEQAAASYTGDNIEKRMLVTRRDAALDALKAKASELRKADPSLANRRLSRRSMETRLIGLWPPPSERRVLGRPCTPSK